MKKRIVLIIVSWLSIASAHAQFFNAIGIAAGQSFSKEQWSTEQWQTQEKYLEGLNIAVFADFFDNPNFQWRTELMYNRLGTKEYVQTVQYVNKTDYFSFNNYFKCSLPLFSWTPYLLIGPRLEYLNDRSAGIFPDVIAGATGIDLSAAVGLGIEKVSFSRVKPFVEVFYNRDIIPLTFNGHALSNSPTEPAGTTTPEKITTIDLEWRIGLICSLERKTKCPHVDNSAGNPPGAK